MNPWTGLKKALGVKPSVYQVVIENLAGGHLTAADVDGTSVFPEKAQAYEVAHRAATQKSIRKVVVIECKEIESFAGAGANRKHPKDEPS